MKASPKNFDTLVEFGLLGADLMQKALLFRKVKLIVLRLSSKRSELVK